MNFLADEDVEKPVVEMLRHEGHDVLYMCEITTRTIDEKLLEQANSESRILLTNDKDYGELVYLQRKVSGGIILMRFVSEKSSVKVQFMKSLVQTHSHLLGGYFTVVREGKVRRRPLR
jgi:predicted nuclease of predicted toxin-antitoxin system